jgi:hypothetical protein
METFASRASIRLACLVVAALLAAFTARRSHAKADHAAACRLGDTTFLLPALLDSAFVLTEFGIRQGIIYQSIPRFALGNFAAHKVSGGFRGAARPRGSHPRWARRLR